MTRNEFKKKIIIGSANFNKRYGVDFTRIKNKEIKKILDLLKKKNIYKIDTAESYFEGKYFLKDIDKKFQFTTKMCPDYRWVSLDYCKNKIDNHFIKFNVNKVETLLFHNFDILFDKVGPKVFKNIETLKKNYFKKIGLSVYDTKHLSYLTSKYNIDVIQAPFNILDKRIVNSGWLKRLKYKGIEVQARSIFLQGILLNKFLYKKKYFKKWKKIFENWFQILEKNNISAVDYCISDLLNYNFDKIIVGINSYNDLNEIINFKKIKIKDKIFNFKENDLRLIDPRKWK